MEIDELLLTDEEIMKIIKAVYGNDVAFGAFDLITRSIEAQLEKIKNNLPSFEEIRLRIVDCQFGGMEVPQLREWLKENLLIKEVENG